MKNIAYKIKNWSDYNKNLIQRGNITIYLEESIINQWKAGSNEKVKRGRPHKYSDFAIRCGLTFRSLYHLPLRATQGFLEGLFKLLEVKLNIPNYTTLCRRANSLNIKLDIKSTVNENIDIVIDSTGLKIYGEGEWKMRTHGKQKRRTWRKLHIAIDPDNHQTISMKLTPGNIHDSNELPPLLNSLSGVNKVYADGAYGFQNCFKAIHNIGAQAVIAVRSGTALVKNPSPAMEQRNKIVKEMQAYGGRSQWQKKSGYHRRSLVENQMYRYKTIFGEKMQSRKFENQFTEAKLKLLLLNQMTNLGMPKTART